MIKISEKYQEEKTGITFEVDYPADVMMQSKRVSIKPSTHTRQYDTNSFTFNRSKPQTIKEVGEALVAISKFVEKL